MIFNSGTKVTHWRKDSPSTNSAGSTGFAKANKQQNSKLAHSESLAKM
jgi:hypothetical protein